MVASNLRLKIYLVVFSILLFVGISGFMFIENMSFIDAVYFSIVTMATVGYGDLHPQTEIGKFLTLIIIIGGVGTFLGVIASITDVFVSRREQAIRQQKIDMVTGLFFSEMGNDLLRHFTRFDPDLGACQRALEISKEWEDEDFERARHLLETHHPSMDSSRGDLRALLEQLQGKADLLLRLIENPIIQEHGRFAELLRALFHLRDELSHRYELSDLLDSDRKHLEGDIARVYRLLVSEWLRYVQYLKGNYGYLYSMAIRLNPFDPEANPVVKD